MATKKNPTIKIAAWTVIAIGVIAACGKSTQGPENPVRPAEASFHWLSDNVFQARCVICHNATNPRAGVDLSSYAALIASPGRRFAVLKPGDAANSGIYIEVSRKKMPPEPRYLPDPELQALHDWIAAGAPEKTPGATLPAPGQPNPPQATYDWLLANALRRCTSCHSLPFKAGNVDFTSYATLLGSVGDSGKALKPGDPDHSGIYTMARGKTMPPKRDGLTADEVHFVELWIQAGARND